MDLILFDLLSVLDKDFCPRLENMETGEIIEAAVDDLIRAVSYEDLGKKCKFTKDDVGLYVIKF